jgi:hypothetical protein
VSDDPHRAPGQVGLRPIDPDPDPKATLTAASEAPPGRLAYAVGQVHDEWADDDPARLESLTDDDRREFWSQVREKLSNWPAEGP